MGDLIKESLKSISDMTTRERAIFAPLVVMTLLLGVYPSITNYDTAVLDSGIATALAEN